MSATMTMKPGTIGIDRLKEIIFQVISQIAPEADLNQLNPDESIQKALDIDSFDFLNMLIGVNQETGVEVPEADYGKVSTLNDLIAYLMTQI